MGEGRTLESVCIGGIYGVGGSEVGVGKIFGGVEGDVGWHKQE